MAHHSRSPARRRSRSLNTHTYIVGIDIGGTANKFTVIDGHGEYLIDHLVELPSRVTEGPKIAIAAMRQAFDSALQLAGVNPHNVRGVGLDTPGPASANGVAQLARCDQLLRPGVARLRRACRARARARPAGRLQQRRQRRRALRPPLPLRPRRGRALVGGGDRRNRPRRRRDRDQAGSSRAQPGWPASWGTCTSRCTVCCSTASRCRAATAGSAATPRAWPRCRASATTCSRSG